jgi:hypothetical protein
MLVGLDRVVQVGAHPPLDGVVLGIPAMITAALPALAAAVVALCVRMAVDLAAAAAVEVGRRMVRVSH